MEKVKCLKKVIVLTFIIIFVMGIAVSASQMKVTSKGAIDNYLKQISVSEGKMSPRFTRGIVEYTVEVESSVKKIEISALAENDDAKIKGTGSKRIKAGNNVFTISVTGKNGDVREYVLIVQRATDGQTEDGNVIANLVEENYDMIALVLCMLIIFFLILGIVFVCVEYVYSQKHPEEYIAKREEKLARKREKAKIKEIKQNMTR